MPPIGRRRARCANLVIDRPTAGRLSAESPGASRLRGQEGLTQEDKAQILDGQALQLRGTVLRLQGRDAEAVAPFEPGARASWSRSAAAASPRPSGCAPRSTASSPASPRRAATRPRPSASTRPRSPCSRPIIRAPRPCSAPRAGSPAIMRAPAAPSRRSASIREIVAANVDERRQPRRACAALLEPYFALLAARGDDPAAVADLFAASQVLVRPGVAQTQAVLARELSGGSDEAARLFRQSVNPDPRHRARAGSSWRGSRRARRRRAATTRADRRASRLARRMAAGPGRDPGAARRNSRATAASRAARSRSPTCSACSGRARPITR